MKNQEELSEQYRAIEHHKVFWISPKAKKRLKEVENLDESDKKTLYHP